MQFIVIHLCLSQIVALVNTAVCQHLMALQAGDSPLQLPPKPAETSGKSRSSPFMVVLRLLLGSRGGFYYFVLPVYMWMKNKIWPRSLPGFWASKKQHGHQCLHFQTVQDVNLCSLPCWNLQVKYSLTCQSICPSREFQSLAPSVSNTQCTCWFKSIKL